MLRKTTDFTWFLLILALYTITYTAGANIIANAITFVFIGLTFIEVLIKKYLKLDYMCIVTFIFVIICALSVNLSKTIMYSELRTMTVAQLFILIIAVYQYIDNRDRLDKTIWFFSIAGLAASVYILLTADFSEQARLGYIIGDLNTVGIIIAWAYIMALYKFMFENRKIVLPGLLIMLGAIILTGSRSSLIVAIAGTLILAILQARKSAILKSLIWGSATIGTITGLLWLVMNNQYLYTITGSRIESMFRFLSASGPVQESSAPVRAFMISFGWELFKEKPLLGYGIESYSIELLNAIGIAMFAHNNYIELLVGVGLFGTIIYYSKYLWQIVKLSAILRNKSNEDSLVNLWVALIASVLVAHNFLVFYYMKHEGIILAVISAYLLLAGKRNQNDVKDGFDTKQPILPHR